MSGPKYVPDITGTCRGCKRGSAWCAFSRWHEIFYANDRGEGLIKNLMQCMIEMNHIPRDAHVGGTEFDSDHSSIWMTATESYGSTIDGYVGYSGHQRGEDTGWSRFYTGNEDFVLPGDDDSYEDKEVRLEEACKNIGSSLRVCLEDLIYNGNCRITAIGLDEIEVKGLSRDVITYETTLGYAPGRDPSCPCYLHPAMMFIPSFSLVRKLVEILLKEGDAGEVYSIIGKMNRYIEQDRGNLRKLLGDPAELDHFSAMKAMVIRVEKRILGEF